MPLVLATALFFGQLAPVSDSYVRSAAPAKGVYALETAVSRMTAPGKPDVWLVGVAHIGDKAYYKRIQHLLNSQDQVLFEGVKQTDGQTRLKKPVVGQKNKPIYQVLSDALGLDFQLADIDYNHKNWVDSDLTMEDLQKMNSANPNGKKSAFPQIMQLLDPNSPQTKQIATALKSLTPGTLEALKYFMIEKLSTADPNTAMFDAATSEIILTARNKSVEKYFAKSVASPTPPKSIAIFYGAMHQPGLQASLAQTYGYKVAEKHWFTAATADKNKIDSTGQMMLGMLQQQFDKATGATPKAKS